MSLVLYAVENRSLNIAWGGAARLLLDRGWPGTLIGKLKGKGMDALIDLGLYVDATAAAAAISISPAHRDSVISNLDVLFAHYRLVMGFELQSVDEPATIFHP